MALTLLEMTVGVSIVAVGALAVTSTTLASDRIDAETRDLLVARSVADDLCGEIRAVSRRAADDRANWARTLVEQLEELDGPEPDALAPWAGANAVFDIEVVTDERTDPVRDLDLPEGSTAFVPRDLDGDGVLETRDVTEWANLVPVVVRARWETDGVRRELVRVVHASPY